MDHHFVRFGSFLLVWLRCYEILAPSVERSVHSDQAGVVVAEKANVTRLVQTVCALVPNAMIVLLERVLFV